MAENTQAPPILALPAEIRLAIFEYILILPHRNAGFVTPSKISVCPRQNLRHLVLDDDYSSAAQLEILLTCRQFYADFTRLAFSQTAFVVTETYTPIQARTQILRPCQVDSIRHLSFVAGARQFRDMIKWRRYPFDMQNLNLETLDVVFHSSGHWHYPADFTADIVLLLRRLQNVHCLRFIRNNANIKGFFKTWYNRLIGLVLKEDHKQRYDVVDAPNVESTWWTWSFCEEEQSFEMRAEETRVIMEEDEYMLMAKPLMEEWMRSVESEETDPDPRARNGWA
jgi:hypothetical protein